ncbi:tyrosine-type recombinase/integrase [Streptomyces sp. NPDC005071]
MIVKGAGADRVLGVAGRAPAEVGRTEGLQGCRRRGRAALAPRLGEGQGHIDPTAADELRYRFDRWALESVENRTASKRYKVQCIRALEMYMFSTFGNCDVRSAEHFSKATIGAWVNKMLKTKVKRGSKVKGMSPETLRRLHGLLSSVLKEAVVAEPPLRHRNPCDLTRLPSNDDWGISDDESSDDMEFMTPEEVVGLVQCFPRPSDRMLVRAAYGSGLRWGEISALAARHARNPRPGEYELRVTRAWKRVPGEEWYLGPPKSKAGRRTVEFTAGLWQELLDYGLATLGKDALLFHDGSGGRLPYTTFYDRWMTGVGEAKKRGVLPEWKFPTFHDLRHSHVAALLSDRHSLTYVQRRLGHASIKTTSDRYGHLLETAHTAALVTIDRVMGFTPPARVVSAGSDRGRDGGRAMYVAHFRFAPGRLLGFGGRRGNGRALGARARRLGARRADDERRVDQRLRRRGQRRQRAEVRPYPKATSCLGVGGGASCVRPGRLGGRHESERCEAARLVAVGLRGPLCGGACAPGR